MCKVNKCKLARPSSFLPVCDSEIREPQETDANSHPCTLHTHSSKLCEMVSSLLAKRPESDFFLRTIDMLKSHLDESYSSAIKPIDLETIQGQSKTYASIADFASDVRQIFNCSCTYIPDSQMPVNYSARVLSDFFEETLLDFINKPTVENTQECCVLKRRLVDSTKLFQFSLRLRSKFSTNARRDPGKNSFLSQIETSTLLARKMNVPTAQSAVRFSSFLCDKLWHTSRVESVLRSDATIRHVAAHEKRILGDEDCETRQREEFDSQLQRDIEHQHNVDIVNYDVNKQMQCKQDARRLARIDARRLRDELEQTIDLDRQRYILSSFLEEASAPLHPPGVRSTDKK